LTPARVVSRLARKSRPARLEPRDGRPTTDDDDEHRALAGTTTRPTRTTTDDAALSREGDEGTRRRRGTGRAHDWARRARERAHVCLHIPL